MPFYFCCYLARHLIERIKQGEILWVPGKDAHGKKPMVKTPTVNTPMVNTPTVNTPTTLKPTGKYTDE